jgi:hypothetical protein
LAALRLIAERHAMRMAIAAHSQAWTF